MVLMSMTLPLQQFHPWSTLVIHLALLLFLQASACWALCDVHTCLAVYSAQKYRASARTGRTLYSITVWENFIFKCWTRSCNRACIETQCSEVLSQLSRNQLPSHLDSVSVWQSVIDNAKVCHVFFLCISRLDLRIRSPLDSYPKANFCLTCIHLLTESIVLYRQQCGSHLQRKVWTFLHFRLLCLCMSRIHYHRSFHSMASNLGIASEWMLL